MTRREVVLENGVLAFDSDVVEAFTSQGSNRVPVTQINEVDLTPGSLRISCGGYIKPLMVALASDEAENPELTKLLDDVRGKAPKLEDG